ncbi:MAG: 6-phosphogluconolactonase [Gammaproteobacteria bacterium]
MKRTTLCKDREQAALALSRHLIAVLRNALSERGQASLVVSGGTSPVRLFELLRQEPLDWKNVSVLSSDERLVPSNSPERNERMICEKLLTERASAATLVSLVSDHNDPAACEAFANSNLEKLSRPFDAVVLGMGEDGHTASLFPDAPDLSTALTSSRQCLVQTVPSQERIRISLTPKALLNTRELNLLVFGDSKYSVLEAANGPGDISEFPVRIALHQDQVPVTTYWAP